MATAPEVEEPQPTSRDRIRRAVTAPVSDRARPITLLAISAGLATLAPIPFGGLAAALLVLVAADYARKR